MKPAAKRTVCGLPSCPRTTKPMAYIAHHIPAAQCCSGSATALAIATTAHACHYWVNDMDIFCALRNNPAPTDDFFDQPNLDPVKLSYSPVTVSEYPIGRSPSGWPARTEGIQPPLTAC